MNRPVYLRRAASCSAAGDGAALADACLSRSAPTRAGLSFRSPHGEVTLPYFRIAPCADPALQVPMAALADHVIPHRPRPGLFAVTTSIRLAKQHQVSDAATRQKQ